MFREIIIQDVCYYFFLTNCFVVFYKHHIIRILEKYETKQKTFIGKKWFYGFP